ncbi:MAG TPA: DMT family transporter [Gemmatimonadales bacterium]
MKTGGSRTSKVERSRDAKSAGERAAVRGTLLIVLSAACFGAIAILTALATRAGGDLRGVLFWRYALAVPTLVAVSGGVRALRAGPRDAARVALLGGGGQALLAFATLSALAYIPASALGFLFFTFPAWVALFAAVTGAERMTVSRAAALGLALGGIALMVGAPGAADLHPVGVALALGGAVLYALYIPLLDRLRARAGAVGSTAWVCVGAAIALGVAATVAGAPSALLLPAGAWLPVLGLAVLSTALGFVLFLRGLEILGPVRAAIIATVEPFWTAALGAIVLGEPLTGATIAGGGLIALAVLLLQRRPA